MPLKKPVDIPKIPKARKKKAEAAIAAIPEKKPDKIEYICNTYFHYDKTSEEQTYIVSLSTIAEFTSFMYELNVEVLREKREINIVIMGLSAQTNMAPEVQPARTDILFKDFVGEYTFNIIKQDGCINSVLYDFNTFKREIKIIKEYLPEKENNRWFCKFGVSLKENTFATK